MRHVQSMFVQRVKAAARGANLTTSPLNKLSPGGVVMNEWSAKYPVTESEMLTDILCVIGIWTYLWCLRGGI